MATVRSVLSLISLLPRGRPLEFYDRLTMSSEARLPVPDHREDAYQPVTWETALAALAERYGAAVQSILSEPALGEIEASVRRRQKAIAAPAGGGRPEAIDPTFDADSAFARCCYLLCRLAAPGVVLETGVANGTTSAFLLQAIRMNARGALHSIDFVDTTQAYTSDDVGSLVPEALRGPWHLSFGASRRLLPGLLQRVGQVDLFVHDSAHTYWNMRREFEAVWPALPPGGILIADDVQENPAFAELRERNPAFWLTVAEVDKPSAAFGIAVK